MPTTKQKRSSAGFSLIELVVAVSIMAILAGAAIPVASKILTNKARSATTDELELLADASEAYFVDTAQLPPDVESLVVDPGASLPAWAGPYLPGVVTDSLSGSSGYEVDSWSRPYAFSASGDVLTVTSMGEDGAPGTSADIVIQLDVTSLKRIDTLDRLEKVNLAIQKYNELYLVSDPLPANYNLLYTKLTTTDGGYLPISPTYQTDAWGNSFVEDPVGLTPVVQVTSTHFQ